MGIDAEMFAIIKGKAKWLAPADVLKASYELASTLGHGNFLINSKLEKPLFKGDTRHHALSIVQPHVDKDYERDDLRGKVVWFQDGDPKVAAPDEQFIRVHLWQRYYGPGYERGNWPVIRSTAEWLEVNLPVHEIWYGGDSSGVVAEPFGEAARRAFNHHYLTNGHRPYVHHDNPFKARERKPVCPTCEAVMADTGGGGGQSFWSCDGCGQHAVTGHGKILWLKPRSKIFDYWKAENVLKEEPWA